METSGLRATGPVQICEYIQYKDATTPRFIWAEYVGKGFMSDRELFKITFSVFDKITSQAEIFDLFLQYIKPGREESLRYRRICRFRKICQNFLEQFTIIRIV